MTSKRKRGFKRFAKAAALLSIAISALVLVGWTFQLTILKSILPQWVSMKPNTALAFMAAGTLFFHKVVTIESVKYDVINKVGSLLIFLLGLLTMSQYLFFFDLHIDQVFFKDLNTLGTSSPGRMAPFTAFNFMLLGTSLFLFDHRSLKSYHISDYLSLAMLILSALPLMGYLFDIEFLYGFTKLTKVALPTAALFVILSLGMLMAKTEIGIISLFTQNANVSKVAFKQLLSIILIVLIVSWLRLKGQHAGYFYTEVGLFITSFVFIIVISFVLISGARSMLKSEKRQEDLTHDALENLLLFQGLLESAPDGLVGVNKEGTILFINKQIEVLYGYRKDELIGAQVELLMPEKSTEGDEALGQFYYKNPITRTMGQSTKELTARAKDGREFSVEIGLSSMETKDGLLVISSIRDVTKKRKLEEALRSSDERLSITLASIGDGVISTDAKGKIVYMNSVAEQLTGWTFNEANSRDLSDVYAIIDEYSGTPLTSPLKRIIEDGLVVTLENHTVLVARDGRKLVISNNGAPIRDSEGQIYGAVIVFHDTTEKTNAEYKLAQSNARFNSAFYNNPAAMAIFSQYNDQFIEVNESFESLTGYSLDKLIGKTFEDVAIVDLNDRITIISNLKLRGRIKDEEFYIRSKRGKLKPVLLSMEPIEVKNESDVLITFIDMSGWRDAEQRYHSIFEKTHEGIYQSGPEGKFITANPSMAKIFGYNSPQELISSIDDIGRQIYVDPKERLQMKALLEKTGKAYDLELRALKKNKEIIWVRANVRIERDTNGMIKYFEGTILDITEQKAATEKLSVQFTELQKTNDELDRFVYSASHDLRAPLSSILGLINLAQLEKLSPRSMNYLSLIRTSIERLDGFIKDILNYSRNSRTEVLNDEVDFVELLSTAQANLRFMNGSDHLHVKMEIDKQTLFLADKARCSIVIENILSNAIKYQDFDKASSTLLIRIVQSKKSARICFHDNGLGIEEKHMPKMFNMFYRATDVSTGSGLGLYIMKECILKMKGTVDLKSEYSAFTKIEIEIPNNAP